MKSLLAAIFALVCCAVNAQDVTGNLITNQWTGAIPYNGTGGGVSGGQQPGYNSATNTIHFGYSQGTVAQVIAINNALQGSGVQVGGIQYGATYYNQDWNRGSLSATATVTSNTGATLHQYNHSLGPTVNGWTAWAQTQTFANAYGLANLGNASLSFTGNDDRWWAGYYGPMVKDPYLKLTYTAATVTTPTFGDDTYVAVPLQFGFPFYGRTFTNSWMHSNGVVSFLDPAVPIPGVGYNPGSWAYCCGERVTGTRPEYSFIIAPLLTDLYPSTQSTFRTEGTTTYQKYFWNNIGEISNGNNLNTFSLEIRPSGYIGVTYDKINIGTQNTWVGTAGDVSAGQINERFWGVPGLNAHLNVIPGWSMDSTDVCASNPLSSPTCPGYTEAMCSANPLYSVTCSGYQQAYFSQQCSINPLYNPECPGYAEAYFSQQCSLDPLYNKQCPGYAEAYATQQALKQSTTTVESTTTTTNTTGISDTTVSSVITAAKDTTGTTSPTSVVGPVSVIAPTPQPPAVNSAITSVSVAPPPSPAQQQERQQDQKKTDGAVASVERKSGGDRKEAGRQVAAAAKDAAEKAKNATSLEAQTANQGLVVGLMSYVPGFAAYQNAVVPDALAAQVARQYHKPTVDNRSAQRQLSGANDRLHRDMVEQQYQTGR